MAASVGVFATGMTWEESPVIARTVDLVHWAVGANDYTDFHFDSEAAQSRGFDGPVVNGPWKARAMKAFLEARAEPHDVLFDVIDIDYRLPDVVNRELVFAFEVLDAQSDSQGNLRAEIAGEVRNPVGEVTTKANLKVVVATSLETDELPLDATKDALSMGKAHGPFTYTLHHSDFLRYQQISGRPADEVDDVMPAAFFGAIDPVERRDLDLDSFLLEIPLTKVGGGNAFNEVSYERPIRAGEVLTVMTTYTDVFEKKGRSSRLFFRVRENVYRDEKGEKVAVSTNGHVIAYASEGAQK
ncbi:dehydratase alpha subunit [Pontimonas salivibrio]|uniref:Dehydratase alpha subunit n=1 Tax=Pontimonas salivibrio TaxID=1159327 RepID=A0A2L2BRE4_9MICO|nr:MaoC family dehydratase N-terminal domain-containing protein [Pontimonas salivibrio]AVG24231.1 dehydratase alpha subunit [Pontimonas salivibrio]